MPPKSPHAPSLSAPSPCQLRAATDLFSSCSENLFILGVCRSSWGPRRVHSCVSSATQELACLSLLGEAHRRLSFQRFMGTDSLGALCLCNRHNCRILDLQKESRCSPPITLLYSLATLVQQRSVPSHANGLSVGNFLKAELLNCSQNLPR